MAKTRRDDVLQKKQQKPKEKLEKGFGYIEDRELYYCYYYDENNKRRKLTNKSLDELREKKAELENLKYNLVKVSSREKSLDDVYAEWLVVKGNNIAQHTKGNYIWVYDHYCKKTALGKMKLKDITNGKIIKHYNSLQDHHGLAVSTIDGLQTVINQVLSFAVKERYIPANPALGAMTDMKRNAKREQAHPALTLEEQERLISFVQNNDIYNHWYPIIYVFLMTGMRVGEICGLRWKDCDFENNTISINHSLSYFSESGTCKFICGKPKTKAGYRTIPMLDAVKEALLLQKENLKKDGIKCKAVVEGTNTSDEEYYTDFIFLNKEGGCQHQGTLNKAFKRIIRDANVEATDSDNLVKLPAFSCHNFRSTFITNCARKNISIEVCRAFVGHEDTRVTEEIYLTIHPDWKKTEMEKLTNIFNK